MRILVCLLFILPLFISCNKQSSEKKGDVTLTLLNDSVTYIVPREWENEINHWYENDIIKDSAYNVIRYKLTNNTNKKLLFLLRDIDLIDVESIQLTIKEEGKFKDGSNSLLHPAGTDDCQIYVLEYEQELKNEKAYKMNKLGIGYGDYAGVYEKYLKQQVVISPGESREFTALLPLPFIISEQTNAYYYTFYPNLNYTFSLDYSVNMQDLLEALPDRDEEDLKRNNIEIFDGKLTSNEIKLVRKDTW